MTVSVEGGLTDRARRKAGFTEAVKRMVHLLDLPIDLIATRSDGQARRLGIVDRDNWADFEWLVRSKAGRQDLFFRPRSREYQHLMVNGLRREDVLRLRQEGVEPALAVEQAPGVYDCLFLTRSGREGGSSTLHLAIGYLLRRPIKAKSAADWVPVPRIAAATDPADWIAGRIVALKRYVVALSRELLERLQAWRRSLSGKGARGSEPGREERPGALEKPLRAPARRPDRDR